ncbi:MAG: DNA-3-methyladenine glycosylase I [Phototrophicales bacterium]|nr:MAG: DNA-3-methyladenine glycosylase I [Phototrophicales bacterium]
MQTITRCAWCGDDPLYVAYHDNEWGIPIHDDHQWFERITLEGAQAGLSWITILRRREHYRRAFDHFDPALVARYDAAKIEALMTDTGIIRNRAKIISTISNAQAFLRIQAEFGSFDHYIWRFTDGKTIVNHWRSLSEIPAETDESRAMSKDLKKRGFRFVGATICYAMMQACGMVNDHTLDCFTRQE